MAGRLRSQATNSDGGIFLTIERPRGLSSSPPELFQAGGGWAVGPAPVCPCARFCARVCVRSHPARLPHRKCRFPREIPRSVTRNSSTPRPMTEARLLLLPGCGPHPGQSAAARSDFHYGLMLAAPTEQHQSLRSGGLCQFQQLPPTTHRTHDPCPAHSGFTNQLRRCPTHAIISWFKFLRPPPRERVCTPARLRASTGAGVASHSGNPSVFPFRPVAFRGEKITRGGGRAVLPPIPQNFPDLGGGCCKPLACPAHTQGHGAPAPVRPKLRRVASKSDPQQRGSGARVCVRAVGIVLYPHDWAAASLRAFFSMGVASRMHNGQRPPWALGSADRFWV